MKYSSQPRCLIETTRIKDGMVALASACQLKSLLVLRQREPKRGKFQACLQRSTPDSSGGGSAAATEKGTPSTSLAGRNLQKPSHTCDSPVKGRSALITIVTSLPVSFLSLVGWWAPSYLVSSLTSSSSSSLITSSTLFNNLFASIYIQSFGLFPIP